MASDPFDYLESRADADELIQDFGRAVAVRQVTGSSGPDYAPTNSTTDFATFGARVEFTQKQIQRGNIQTTDQRWLIAAGPLTLLGVTNVAPADKVVVDGVPVEIITADPLNPGGTVVLFDCQLRF